MTPDLKTPHTPTPHTMTPGTPTSSTMTPSTLTPHIPHTPTSSTATPNGPTSDSPPHPTLTSTLPTSNALAGGFTDPARQSARAFRAALAALSQPGRIETLTGAQPPAPLSVAAGTLLLVLADTTTGLYLVPTHDLKPVRDWIIFHTGAGFVTAERATLALGSWDDLQPINRFAIGLPDYPDRSATLIVEMPGLHPQGARLTGPGIASQSHLSLPDIAAFQRNRLLFPLGLDFFFTADDRVAGLPRTTKVEAH